MKKLLLIAILAMSFTSPANSFCDGWEDGFQAALDDCLRVAVTPVCPVEPVNSSGYKTGFGMGYAKAKNKYCDES